MTSFRILAPFSESFAEAGRIGQHLRILGRHQADIHLDVHARNVRQGVFRLIAVVAVFLLRQIEQVRNRCRARTYRR